MTMHTDLIEAGFTYTHVEADFWDAGDGETGPMIVGAPAYDVYEDADVRFYVDNFGGYFIEVIDHAREAFEETMTEWYAGPEWDEE